MPSQNTNTGRPLRIVDLMILTAAIAFASLVFESQQSDYPEDDHWLYQTIVFAYAGLLGVFWASAIWIFLQWKRTGRFFHHPGHWTLGAQMPASMATIGYWIFSCFFQTDISNAENSELHMRIGINYYFAVTGLSLLGSGILIFAACSNSRRWLAPMLLLALSNLATSICTAAYGFYFLGSSQQVLCFQIAEIARKSNVVVMLCIAIAICIAAAIDLRKKVTRDWLHWLGLSAMLAFTVMQLIQFLAEQILNSQ